MKKTRTESEKIRRRELDEKHLTEWKEYKQLHPLEKKLCLKCKNVRILKEFPASYQLRHTCLQCVALKQKQWRKTHPISYRSVGSKISAKAKEHVEKIKKDVPCKICGKTWPPYVMDFHHNDMTTKKAALSKMTGSGVNRLNSEISKCELVCANCHRNESFLSKDLVPVFKNRKERQELIDIPTKPGDTTKACELCGKVKSEVNFTKLKTGRLHTYCKSCLRIQNRKYAEKENRKRSSKEYIIAQKDNKPCTDCGKIFRYWMLDFDHVRGDKTKNVSILQNRALKQIKEEIEKCELVCVNCHRIRTYNKRNAIENKQEKIDQIDLQKIRIITLNKIETAKQILEKYHYAGFGRPASNVFEAVYGEEIVAVVKFAPVVRKEVATKENYDHIRVLELDRFCIIPKFQIKNAASKILSLVVPLIKKERPDIKLLVSFADMAQGHDGTIYKASNWRFVGTCADSYVYERDDGTRINKKTLYDTAKRNGLKEKEYAASLGLSKVITPGKHKFIYEL